MNLFQSIDFIFYCHSLIEYLSLHCSSAGIVEKLFLKMRQIGGEEFTINTSAVFSLI